MATFEENQKYRKTKKGVITSIYNKQIQSSKKRGMNPPEYNLDEFRTWCMSQDSFHYLFEIWEQEKYARWSKPSVDRIDCLKGYIFDNIQIMTAGDNKRKGDLEKRILWDQKKLVKA